MNPYKKCKLCGGQVKNKKYDTCFKCSKQGESPIISGTNNHQTNIKTNQGNLPLSGDPFLNPYNFIEVPTFTPRYAASEQETFTGHSGFIDVEMELETPLFIGGNRKESNEVKDHNIIEFFSVNNRPVIPGSSLRGMLRNRMEVLSNSCFNHDYAGDDLLNYMTHRLDLNDLDNKKIITKEVLNLKAGVIVKRKDDWYFIKLEQAKVLTVADIRKNEGNLYLAKNKTTNVPEKISIRGDKTGIYSYNDRKGKRCDIAKVTDFKVDTGAYRIGSMNGLVVNEKEMNKTFPFINLETFDNKEQIYGIIRKLVEKKTFGRVQLYRLKELSTNIDILEKKVNDYRNGIKEEYDYKKKTDNDLKEIISIEYEVCELVLKTSYDIETKTQDKVFFSFGEKDIRNHINSSDGIKLDKECITKFINEINRRSEEFEKHKEKDHLSRYQPKEMYTGMPVFAHVNNNKVEYLAYSQVARKPYKYSIDDIIKKIKKEPCQSAKELCPACNIFGFTAKNDAIASKISVSDGDVTVNQGFSNCILKVLASPKPSYYPFYLLNNRKNKDGAKVTYTYDNDLSSLTIGRKNYLNHHSDYLDYRASEQTKFNVTVNLLKEKSRFSFKISYSNLNNYELGLLLYSIKTSYYDGKEINFRLGMGKPLGLGQLKVFTLKVNNIDRIERYKKMFSVNNFNLSITPISGEDIAKFINIYQYISSQKNQVDFDRAINEYESIPVSDFTVFEVKEFFMLTHIKDFISISLINKSTNRIDVKYPAKLNSNNELLGYEWFMSEKYDKSQRLFMPVTIDSISIEDIVLKNYGV
jgi:CRISPR-associated protein (TIGR03986 family)